MKLTETHKELISRGTMAAVAIVCALGATKLVFVLIAAETWAVSDSHGVDIGLLTAKILIPVIVVLYLLAFAFGCFVFCAWDKRKSDPGRTMAIADKIGNFFSLMWGLLFNRFY